MTAGSATSWGGIYTLSRSDMPASHPGHHGRPLHPQVPPYALLPPLFLLFMCSRQPYPWQAAQDGRRTAPEDPPRQQGCHRQPELCYPTRGSANSASIHHGDAAPNARPPSSTPHTPPACSTGNRHVQYRKGFS